MLQKISFTASLEDFNLIILNQELDSKFVQFWKSSKLKIVADGAANLLYDHDPLLVPDYILGDFDSISTDVLDYYKERSKVVQVDDQNSTDFQKCINKIIEIESGGVGVESNINSSIFAIGALSGRLDHTMSCLHTLMQYPYRRIFLISTDSIATLVNAGETEIYCHKDYEGMYFVVLDSLYFLDNANT
jgi:thiamine pyrophosphokinase